MPDKTIIELAAQIVNHRGWNEFLQHMDRSYFARWLSSETTEQREDIHTEFKAFRRMAGKLRTLDLGDQ